ncbi:Uu.00g111990.m01.CDS01 [Anthostomella pinea]|uniref:Uu.00g111990.m01.CDS01 n=1 Tax=Anthostomella pinea TaxID=933095 RepID=A0AAI8VFW5_9PEZI|nr:Uu.00g111990.m01.CDS01 [Anthostomella pinea]
MEETNTVLAKAFVDLSNIFPEIHLFCPKISEQDEEVYEDSNADTKLSAAQKEQRIQDGTQRLDLMYSCSLILGMEKDAAGQFGQQFATRCNDFLRTCPTCVRNWHKARRPFLKDLTQWYNDEIVAELEKRLNQFDFDRITTGLDAARDFILRHEAVVTQSTFVKEGNAELLVALYEAICCMPYLSIPENRKHFNYVFEKIQERKILKLDQLLPTTTFFLFDEDVTRNRFAVHTFEQGPLVTKEDFDWAVDKNLENAILKANDVNADVNFLQRFWQGFLYILDALDENLVVESLRGMTVQPSIYDLLLAQIPRMTSAPVLKLLLKAFRALLKKSSKAFWDSYSQFSPTSVLEQVIRSPAFRPLLSQSGPHDITTDGPVAISWVKPFVESISTNQKTDVCDKLVHHLLGDFAVDQNMSSEGKVACRRGVVEALSSSLAGFVSPKYKIHAGSSTIHTNALLNLTLKHKDLIIQLSQLEPADQQSTAMSQAGLSVIRYALALDSKITSEECNAIHASDKNVQREVRRDSAGIWEAFLEILQPGAFELAKAMLAAFVPLITVEIFRPPKRQALSSTKRDFNTDFQKTTEVIGRVVDRLEDFDSATLGRLCLDSTTIYPIVAALIHGEDPVNQAGTSFIKAVTGEERRAGAVLKLLERFFVPALSAYTTAVNDITKKKSLWSPQFHILKYSGEILSSLCDPSSGILRSRSLTSAEQEVLGRWWSSQWELLDNAFNQTDGWSRMIEMDTMKDFCRDAMEHADALLAQDGLLASAQSFGSSHATSAGDSKQAMRDILEQPRKNCMGLCKMLRLKDIYLVSVIVRVLGKLLRRLVEYGMEVPSQPLAYIRGTCIKNQQGKYDTPTNMNGQQRAELVRALGEEEAGDDVQILSVRKAEGLKKQTRIDAWSKSVDNEPSAVPKEKIPVRSSKDDIRDLLKASSSEENRSTLDQIRARQATKPLAKPPPISTIPSIREKRAKEAEEKRKRDAEAIAKAKALRAPKQIVSGEGSGLQGLSGVHGKDHAPQKSEIMVNSSSEDEDDSDDAEFLAKTAAGQRRGEDVSKRIQAMKLNPRGPVKKVKIQRSAKDMRARLVPPMDILHQAILEWDIFHDGNDPPNGITCSKVSDSYSDPSEYKQTFLPLLINEAWRSFVTAKNESTSKPFGIKVVNRMSVDKFIEVSTAMPKAENKDKFLAEGDIILFSHASNPLMGGRDELHCLARIWRTQFKNGSLEIQYRLSSRAGPILQTLMPQSELFAIKITNMTTIEREYASLESLQYYDLAPEVLEAKPSPMLKFSPEAVEKTMQNYHLNTGQAKAILNAKENDAFTLVQGPPGTGKTKTIVAMVGALLTGNMSVSGGTAIKRPDGLGSIGSKGTSIGSKGTSKKLLVCAPSNAAVDELVLRLKAGVKSTNGSFHKINVLRLGRSDAINAAVKDVTLDELVKARVEGHAAQNNGPTSRELMHKEAGEIKTGLAELRPRLEAARATGDRAQINQLQRKFDEMKRRQAQIGSKIDADKDSGNTAARENEIRRRQIQQEVLDSAHVLCATLSGSAHDMFKNLAVEFETVIIDEAAQCVELSALIPLKYGCSKCILVGDPKQLPPTVLSQSAARFGYDQSLFVRMQRNHPEDVHLLDTQYRMHPEISQFPSQEFYERQLFDGDDMGKLRQQPWHQSALLGPYRFFDVKGSQERGRSGQSLVNHEELKTAMQLYERFRTDYPNVDAKGKIGIITPYKAQLFELRDQFSRKYGDGIKDIIDFNTTDAFQGRECEIIIFSCVRASPTGGIGFMRDIRRMNVGLTRAKSSLWILGDSRALVQGEFWNKLIENAKVRDRYTTGDIMSMLRRPGAKAAPPTFNSPAPSAAPISQLPSPRDTVMGNSGTVSRSSNNNLPKPTSGNGTNDVTMRDAPPFRGPVNRPRPPKLSQFGGLNERGEPATISSPTSDRPIIHQSGQNQSGQKRARDGADDGKAPKRDATKRTSSNATTAGSIGNVCLGNSTNPFFVVCQQAASTACKRTTGPVKWPTPTSATREEEAFC